MNKSSWSCEKLELIFPRIPGDKDLWSMTAAVGRLGSCTNSLYWLAAMSKCRYSLHWLAVVSKCRDSLYRLAAVRKCRVPEGGNSAPPPRTHNNNINRGQIWDHVLVLSQACLRAILVFCERRTVLFKNLSKAKVISTWYMKKKKNMEKKTCLSTSIFNPLHTISCFVLLLKDHSKRKVDMLLKNWRNTDYACCSGPLKRPPCK